MEAHKIKPTGGIYGEEIAATATEEEWHGVLQDLIYARYHMRLRSASADLISTLEGLGVHQ